MQRYRDEILWSIVVAFLRCRHLIFQYNARLVSQGSVHSSRKLKMFKFFRGLHTHQTCHPLSMFGMLWIDVCNSVFQFPPISSHFAQPL